MTVWVTANWASSYLVQHLHVSRLSFDLKVGIVIQSQIYITAVWLVKDGF
jgi:hypothetical protein